jgi:hypothetical protein
MSSATMTNKKLRVFLSHTSDFGTRPAKGNTYLDAAIRAVNAAEAVLTDMSLLPATEISPAELSAGLAADTDLYVGIIGWRYGSPVRETPDVSYTQLEFRNAGAAGVPRLVFLLDGDAASSEADPYAERQLAFRREIEDSGITIQRFDSPAGLETVLYRSLVNPPAWDPALLQIFLSAVEESAGGERLGGLPAAEGINLSVTAMDGAKEIEADSVLMSAEFSRLVILGGPGAGKSWVARRIAIASARRGLEQLENKVPLNQIELPLFVLTAPFFARVEQSTSVWQALVTQAIRQLERSLPNQRSMDRLRRMLEPRTDRYVLIIDGLDEAGRLGTTTAEDIFNALIQPDSRLVVTSRPGSWRGQLDMKVKSSAREGEGKTGIVELQSLKPAQVRQFIESVLGKSAAAKHILGHLATHPALADLACVPLVARLLAIAAAGAPVETLHDIYDRAINRILRGEWRTAESSQDLEPYKRARNEARHLAWLAATEQNDALSGLAAWTDTIDDDLPVLDPDTGRAFDNVVPVVERDIENLTERRQFIHQTLRERLVADYITTLPVEDAANALEPHLWFDETWKSIVPACVVFHPKRNKLLSRLLFGTTNIPDDPVHAFRLRDGLGELRSMLGRIPTEAPDFSCADDPVLRQVIEQLPELGSNRTRLLNERAEFEQPHLTDRTQLAHDLPRGVLGSIDKIESRIHDAGFSVDERWELSKSIQQLLMDTRRLASDGTLLTRRHLAVTLAALKHEPTIAEVRTHLVETLSRADAHAATDIVTAVVALKPTENERRLVIPPALQALAAPGIYAWDATILVNSLISLEPSREERKAAGRALAQKIQSEKSAGWTHQLIQAFGKCGPSAEEIAGLIMRTFSGGVYRDHDYRDQKMIKDGLYALAAASENPDDVLLELVRAALREAPGSEKIAMIELLSSRATSRGRDHAVRELREALVASDRWIYFGSSLLLCLEAPTEVRSTVIERLLAEFDKPNAPFVSIGQEIAALGPTASQRDAAIRHELTWMRDPDDTAVTGAAKTIARLNPEPEDREQALSLLRQRIPTVSGLKFHEVIEAIASLSGGVLTSSDVAALVNELETRLGQESLGFIWAGTLVGVGNLDRDMRKRIIQARLPAQNYLTDVGFSISVSDQLVDAEILAKGDAGLCRLVGDVYIELMRNSERIAELEPGALDVLLFQFRRLVPGTDQQQTMASLSLQYLPEFISKDPYRASALCRSWRALQPSPGSRMQLEDVLSKSIQESTVGWNTRMLLLEALLATGPSPQNQLLAGETVVDAILAGKLATDSSRASDLLGRVAVTAGQLRRLSSAPAVPVEWLRVAAASARRSMSFAAWMDVLPALEQPHSCPS